MFSIFFVVFTLFVLFISPADAEEMADLGVEKIYPDIPEPQAGDDVIFTVEYANIGTSGTNESFVILFFIDGELAGETEVFPLDPGESESADFFIHIENDFGGGEHSAAAVIDPGELVPESDEWNNEFSEFFYVAEIEETEIEEPEIEETGMKNMK